MRVIRAWSNGFCVICGCIGNVAGLKSFSEANGVLPFFLNVDDIEAWQLGVLFGLVVSVSIARQILIEVWPEFAESSDVANQQVMIVEEGIYMCTSSTCTLRA